MEDKRTDLNMNKIVSVILFLILFAGLMIFLFSGGNFEIILNIFRNDMSPEEIQDSLKDFGIRGYITIGVLSTLQVILTFLPSEPVQIVAGLSFGLVRGGLACLAGIFLANSLVFLIHKRNAQRLTEWFEQNAEFDFNAAKKSRKIVFIVLLLYLIPVIPYGLICFFAASLDLKYPKYILMTTLSAIPSVAVGVGLGHLALASGWLLSVIVCVFLIIAIIIITKNKTRLIGMLNDYMKKHKATSSFQVRKPDRLFSDFVALCTKFFLFGKVKIHFKNNVGKLEHPSIVLVNHGAFLDFVYAGRLIRKERPNFMLARLYTYHKVLGKLIKRAGAYPKSMFSADLENAKNCIRVISSGGVLIMMPEARLSTVGEFEDIQDSTYKFIKKMAVPVYMIKLEGDYLAKPKWGDKIRRGSVVYSTLDILYTKEQIDEISVDELRLGIDRAFDYNELKWLETMPEIHYKSKTMAEGLENILVRCPECGARYSIVTKGATVSCSECGSRAVVDDRYAFVESKPFANFAEWYRWQKGEMEKEILSDPNYKLENKVVLKHSSKDGKTLLRYAGEGICTLNRQGLVYRGTEDGEEIEKFFPLKDIYRLLFGSGQDFEIYEGKEIWYFVPEEIRACVDYYTASELLKKHFDTISGEG